MSWNSIFSYILVTSKQNHKQTSTLHPFSCILQLIYNCVTHQKYQHTNNTVKYRITFFFLTYFDSTRHNMSSQGYNQHLEPLVMGKTTRSAWKRSHLSRTMYSSFDKTTWKSRPHDTLTARASHEEFLVKFYFLLKCLFILNLRSYKILCNDSHNSFHKGELLSFQRLTKYLKAKISKLGSSI